MIKVLRPNDALREGSGKASVCVAEKTETGENIHRAVWALAWPTIIANLLQNASSLINLYFVHGLGVKAMDAVAWGEVVLGIVFAVSTGVSVGATALVARAEGAEDVRSRAEAARQSLLLGALLALFTLVSLGLTARVILRALGADHHTMPVALSYYHAMLWCMPGLFTINIAAAVFRGTGNTRTPMVILAGMNVLNILLDAVLIWGFGPFPALGVRGAAYATAAARTVSAALFLWALWRSTDRLLHGAPSWRPSPAWWGRLLNVGLPAAIQAGMRTAAMASFTGLLGRMPHGMAVVAALSVGLRAEGLAFMPGMAFNIAAAALVGQSLGGRDPARANRAAWSACWQSVGIMSLMGLVFFVGADPIARALAAPEAQPFAADYLRIMAVCQPFLAIAMTLTGALQGAGDTVKPLIVMIITMWVLRLPATWFFGLEMAYGANAAWWAMSITTCVQGLLIAWFWRAGAWRRVRL